MVKSVNVSLSVVCKKAKSGNTFVALRAQFPYGDKLIFLKDKADLLTLCDMTPSQFANLKDGDIINLTKGE